MWRPSWPEWRSPYSGPKAEADASCNTAVIVFAFGESTLRFTHALSFFAAFAVAMCTVRAWDPITVVSFPTLHLLMQRPRLFLSACSKLSSFLPSVGSALANASVVVPERGTTANKNIDKQQNRQSEYMHPQQPADRLATLRIRQWVINATNGGSLEA